jgi:hypothetical protein
MNLVEAGEPLASQDALPPRSGGGRGAPNRVNQFGRLGRPLNGARHLRLLTAIVVSVVVLQCYVLIAHSERA